MKTLKNIFILVFIISSMDIIAQNTVYTEQFDNNNQSWVIGNNDTRELKIFNGRYYFDNKKESSWTVSSKTFNLTSSQNFEIETSIQKISGVNNYGYGFYLKKQNADAIEITVSGSGYFRTDKIRNNKYEKITGWTKSSAVKKGNYSSNKLKIRKVNNTITFYINGTLVDTQTIYNTFGNRVGFVINNKQKISIDYIKVKTISGSDNSYVNTTKKKNSTSKKAPFYESFSSNKNDWSLDKNQYVNFSLYNGKYYLEHKLDKGGYSSSISRSIDTGKDFEISTKIDKVSGVTDIAYGLMWGRSKNNSFRFFITSNGYYKVVRYVEGKEEKIISWKKTSYVKKGNGNSNILTLKKQKNRYLFYINGNYINESDFEPFYGNYIGYVLYNNQKIAIDYLDVKYNTNNTINNNKTVVSRKKLIAPIKDDFLSNTNQWIIGSTDNYSAKITNGKFILERKIKGGLFFKNDVEIDTQKDFIIETSLDKLSGQENLVYGFTFGRKNSANEYSFFISNSGSYSFRKYENNEYKSLIPWTNTNVIKAKLYKTNKIKIVKANNLLRFYINDTYLNEFPFGEFYGNQLGFTVYDKQKIAVNYLDIKYQTNSYNNPPIIAITEPNVEPSRGFKIVQAKKVLVRGTATDPDGVYEITINGTEANVAEDGSFTANVPLKYGKNELIVKATDLKQATSTKKFTIKRKSNSSYADNPTNDDELDIGFGKYYALIIGVSNYQSDEIKDLLGEPTKDAKKLKQVLTTHYNFKSENVTLLLNAKANDITKEFFKLRRKVTKNDNVLVFFAGHGIFQDEIGSWLPSDAKVEYGQNLINNSQVKDYLKAIKSKHTLLISDACFSGSIFSTRSVTKAPKTIQLKYEKPSRKAITSGVLKTVPNKSVLFKYLSKRLINNKNKYLSASRLFSDIEDAVINNNTNNNKPLYAPINGIGDEGGDFIFIKK